MPAVVAPVPHVTEREPVTVLGAAAQRLGMRPLE
jgi:hypothetical protein